MNHRGIEGKECLLQINGNRLIPAKALSNTDKNVAKVLKDAVIATFICIGESSPGNRAMKTGVIACVPMGIETGFNVSQTLTSRHLSICQTEELIESGKGLSPVLSSIARTQGLTSCRGRNWSGCRKTVLPEFMVTRPKVTGRVPPVEIESEQFCQRA